MLGGWIIDYSKRNRYAKSGNIGVIRHDSSKSGSSRFSQVAACETKHPDTDEFEACLE
jgi:hypothetical protein